MPGPLGTAIAMFAKAPVAGRVKTRLAGALTPRGSASLHRACALATWGRLVELEAVDPYLYCDRAWAEFRALAGPGRFRLQRGADLGERMRLCLSDLLAGGYRRALIVGSDSPTMPLAHVLDGIAALERAETVLGPSEDGGFALIGATRVEPEMFEGVRWSSQDTCRDCLAAMRSSGLRAAQLQATHYDVDTPADLERLRRDPALPVSLRQWFTRQRGGDS